MPTRAQGAARLRDRARRLGALACALWLTACARAQTELAEPRAPREVVAERRSCSGCPSAAAPRLASGSLSGAGGHGAARAPASSLPAPAGGPGAQSEPGSASDDDLVIVAGGDVNLGREVGQQLQRVSDYAPLAGIAPLWERADLRFVNLESTLSFQHGETQSPLHRLIFTGPPEGADALRRARVDVVSTANNHAWDYGRSALFETLERLAQAGVLAAGSGRSSEQALAPAVMHVKGRSIAIFAVTQIWNQGPFALHEARDYVAWASVAALAPRLAEARREHDLVLVSYHGGSEYQDAPSEPTRYFVHAVLEAGADAVIGHHPHVVQGVGWEHGRPAFFSLGNLVFGARNEILWTRYGMLAKLTFPAHAAPRYALCPYRIERDLPKLIERRRERERFFAHVVSASTAVGGTRLGAADADGCVEVLPLNRPFYVRPRADRAARPLAQR